MGYLVDLNAIFFYFFDNFVWNWQRGEVELDEEIGRNQEF